MPIPRVLALLLSALLLCLCLPKPTSALPRIVPLYAAFTEILVALDCQDALVARTQTDTQPSLASLPVIGTHMQPNLERLVALKPDIVLQLAGRSLAHAQAERLRSLGIRVEELDLATFSDIFAVTERLGALLGRKDKASALVDGWKKRLHEAKALRPKKTYRLFFEVRYPGLLAAGRDNIVNSIIALSGGVNVVGHPKKLVRLGEETVFALDPDVYVVQKGPMNPNPLPFADRPGFDRLAAIAKGHTLLVREELFSRPGPASIEAVMTLSTYLHALEVSESEAKR